VIFGVLSLRNPVGAREGLRAVGGPRFAPPLRPDPRSENADVEQLELMPKGWRGGEASTARTEGRTVEVRSDRTPKATVLEPPSVA